MSDKVLAKLQDLVGALSASELAGMAIGILAAIPEHAAASCDAAALVAEAKAWEARARARLVAARGPAGEA